MGDVKIESDPESALINFMVGSNNLYTIFKVDKTLINSTNYNGNLVVNFQGQHYNLAESSLVELLLKNIFSIIAHLQDVVKGLINNNNSKENKDKDNDGESLDKTCAESVKQVKYDPCKPNTLDYSKVIGLSTQKETIMNSFAYPLVYRNLYPKATKGMLFWGPPGGGKTYIMKATLNEIQRQDPNLGILYYAPTGANLKSKWVGGTEKNIAAYFDCASRDATWCEKKSNGKKFLSIIFIDEIEAVAKSRDKGGEQMTNSVNTLLQKMDGVESYDNVAVVAATNYPWSLDSAILRRLPKRIYLPVPTRKEGKQVLEMQVDNYFANFKSHKNSLKVSDDCIIKHEIKPKRETVKEINEEKDICPRSDGKPPINKFDSIYKFRSKKEKYFDVLNDVTDCGEINSLLENVADICNGSGNDPDSKEENAPYSNSDISAVSQAAFSNAANRARLNNYYYLVRYKDEVCYMSTLSKNNEILDSDNDPQYKIIYNNPSFEFEYLDYYNISDSSSKINSDIIERDVWAILIKNRFNQELPIFYSIENNEPKNKELNNTHIYDGSLSNLSDLELLNKILMKYRLLSKDEYLNKINPKKKKLYMSVPIPKTLKQSDMVLKGDSNLKRKLGSNTDINHYFIRLNINFTSSEVNEQLINQFLVNTLEIKFSEYKITSTNIDINQLFRNVNNSNDSVAPENVNDPGTQNSGYDESQHNSSTNSVNGNGNELILKEFNIDGKYIDLNFKTRSKESDLIKQLTHMFKDTDLIEDSVEITLNQSGTLRVKKGEDEFVRNIEYYNDMCFTEYLYDQYGKFEVVTNYTNKEDMNILYYDKNKNLLGYNIKYILDNYEKFKNLDDDTIFNTILKGFITQIRTHFKDFILLHQNSETLKNKIIASNEEIEAKKTSNTNTSDDEAELAVLLVYYELVTNKNREFFTSNTKLLLEVFRRALSNTIDVSNTDIFVDKKCEFIIYKFNTKTTYEDGNDASELNTKNYGVIEFVNFFAILFKTYFNIVGWGEWIQDLMYSYTALAATTGAVVAGSVAFMSGVGVLPSLAAAFSGGLTAGTAYNNADIAKIYGWEVSKDLYDLYSFHYSSIVDISIFNYSFEDDSNTNTRDKDKIYLWDLISNLIEFTKDGKTYIGYHIKNQIIYDIYNAEPIVEGGEYRVPCVVDNTIIWTKIPFPNFDNNGKVNNKDNPDFNNNGKVNNKDNPDFISNLNQFPNNKFLDVIYTSNNFLDVIQEHISEGTFLLDKIKYKLGESSSKRNIRKYTYLLKERNRILYKVYCEEAPNPEDSKLNIMYLCKMISENFNHTSTKIEYDNNSKKIKELRLVKYLLTADLNDTQSRYPLRSSSIAGGGKSEDNENFKRLVKYVLVNIKVKEILNGSDIFIDNNILFNVQKIYYKISLDVYKKIISQFNDYSHYIIFDIIDKIASNTNEFYYIVPDITDDIRDSGLNLVARIDNYKNKISSIFDSFFDNFNNWNSYSKRKMSFNNVEKPSKRKRIGGAGGIETLDFLTEKGINNLDNVLNELGYTDIENIKQDITKDGKIHRDTVIELFNIYLVDNVILSEIYNFIKYNSSDDCSVNTEHSTINPFTDECFISKFIIQENNNVYVNGNVFKIIYDNFTLQLDNTKKEKTQQIYKELKDIIDLYADININFVLTQSLGINDPELIKYDNFKSNFKKYKYLFLILPPEEKKSYTFKKIIDIQESKILQGMYKTGGKPDEDDEDDEFFDAFNDSAEISTYPYTYFSSSNNGKMTIINPSENGIDIAWKALGQQIRMINGRKCIINHTSSKPVKDKLIKQLILTSNMHEFLTKVQQIIKLNIYSRISEFYRLRVIANIIKFQEILKILEKRVTKQVTGWFGPSTSSNQIGFLMYGDNYKVIIKQFGELKKMYYESVEPLDKIIFRFKNLIKSLEKVSENINDYDINDYGAPKISIKKFYINVRLNVKDKVKVTDDGVHKDISGTITELFNSNADAAEGATEGATEAMVLVNTPKKVHEKLSVDSFVLTEKAKVSFNTDKVDIIMNKFVMNEANTEKRETDLINIRSKITFDNIIDNIAESEFLTDKYDPELLDNYEKDLFGNPSEGGRPVKHMSTFIELRTERLNASIIENLFARYNERDIKLIPDLTIEELKPFINARQKILERFDKDQYLSLIHI